MENFEPISATVGGLLLGLSATLLLLLQGRIAGISGILGGLLPPSTNDAIWRLLFIVGLVAGAALYRLFGGGVADLNVNPFALSDGAHLALLVAGGLLVGFGTRIGSGCTSGHGICGLGLLSIRSLGATLTFMLTAGLTGIVIRLAAGG